MSIYLKLLVCLSSFDLNFNQNKANEFLSDELSKFEEIQTLVVNDPSLKQSIAKLDAKLLPTQLLANYHLSLFVSLVNIIIHLLLSDLASFKVIT
jgi:hypothetical protein